MPEILKIDKPFVTETGKIIPGIEIAYDIPDGWKEGRPVVWVCHALTGNSNPVDWWPGIVGKGKYVDTCKYNVVCANFLGSCYGTTGPMSINPETDEPWYLDFPLITIRDMVKAHEILRLHLGIKQIDLIIGASMGAFQGIEWAIEKPGLIKAMVFLVASAQTSPWCRAINEAQRMAMQADPSFFERRNDAGQNGLKAARAIGMFTFRNFDTFQHTQRDTKELFENYRACTYQRYQGEKLVKRFNAHSFYYITKAFDSHDVGRNRGKLDEVLSTVNTRTLCISTDSDILFPVKQVHQVAEWLPDAKHEILKSMYGHDGFLIDNDKLTTILKNWDYNID